MSLLAQIAKLVQKGYPESTAKRIATGELPMDEASRMQRARDQGYGIDRPTYHGTHADIAEFDPDMVDLGVHTGTPEQAATRLKDVAVQRGELGSRFGGDQYGSGANILELATRASNPLEMEDVGDFMNSQQVIEGLLFNSKFTGDKDSLKDLYQEADDLAAQFFGSDELFRDSAENREILDELKSMIRAKGYDSVRYRNQVEGVAGGEGLTKQAQAQMNELYGQMRALENAEQARRANGSPGFTESELALRSDLNSKINQLRNDPASKVDNTSLITLDPENIRSTNAAFDPEYKGSNILGGLAGAGTVGLLSAIPDDAMAIESYAEPVVPMSVGQYGGGLLNALVNLFGPDIQGNIGDGTLTEEMRQRPLYRQAN